MSALQLWESQTRHHKPQNTLTKFHQSATMQSCAREDVQHGKPHSAVTPSTTLPKAYAAEVSWTSPDLSIRGALRFRSLDWIVRCSDHAFR